MQLQVEVQNSSIISKILHFNIEVIDNVIKDVKLYVKIKGLEYKYQIPLTIP